MNHNKIHLTINTLQVKVIQSLLPLGKYLLLLPGPKRYQTRDSNGIFIFATTSIHVSIVKYGQSLVTIFYFGFAFNSVSLMNSVKVIEGKLKYVLFLRSLWI